MRGGVGKNPNPTLDKDKAKLKYISEGFNIGTAYCSLMKLSMPTSCSKMQYLIFGLG